MAGSDKPLEGRTALVTGAARRIGRAIALRLAADGAGVVIHYRASAAEAEACQAEIVDAGGRAWTVRADLARPDEAETLLARARQAAGGIDAVINNASVFPESGVRDFTLAEHEADFRVNAWAPLVLARALAAGGGPGDVVNLLDCRIVDYDAAHAAYHLTKRSLATLTRMLALELAPEIQVNAVAPGLILPPPGQDESFLADHAHTNPMNTWGSPEEVASAVAFCLTARFVTGQVLYIDGGRHMKGRVYE